MHLRTLRSRSCKLPQLVNATKCAGTRQYASVPATATQAALSPFAPRHLLSIADLSLHELNTLIRNAASHKSHAKANTTSIAIRRALLGQSVALIFSKLSTRTRVSTEAAVAHMGGHAMFLGKNDIQLGVNETLHDSSVVISSMVSCIVARVNAHADVAEFAKHSSVPVINALSDLSHPLQTIADYLTIHQAFPTRGSASSHSLGLQGLKIAWLGDANNVCCDLTIAAQMLGIHVSVCTPRGYELTEQMRGMISDKRESVDNPGSLTETLVPEEAVKDADIIVTDTWVNMGQEAEKAERLKAFGALQVTTELAERGGAKEDWKFMHCLPRHQYEVTDQVFYGPRSMVFPEAENRLWAMIGESCICSSYCDMLILSSCARGLCRQQGQNCLSSSKARDASTRRQRAVIDNVLGLLVGALVATFQRCTRQCHETYDVSAT